jgi:hypothetical protein
MHLAISKICLGYNLSPATSGQGGEVLLVQRLVDAGSGGQAIALAIVAVFAVCSPSDLRLATHYIVPFLIHGREVS